MKTLRILLLFLLLSGPAQAQRLNINLTSGASTPCIADFEDFIVFIFAFYNPDADADFQPIADINGDGEINLNDFFLFRDHFYKPICLPIDSLLTVDHTKIVQEKTDDSINGNVLSLCIGVNISSVNP